MNNDKLHVTVIGLGAMGRAMAEALLNAGHPVTVWNRSATKADALVERGARRAGEVAEALGAGDVTIVCVLDYPAVRALLEPAAGALEGRTIVNLTNGSPDEARAMEQWITSQGAAYLDGGIMAIPPTVGTPGAFVFVSGEEDVARRAGPAIAPLGEPIEVGRDAGLASLYDIALLSGMFGISAGVHHAVALVASVGGDVERFKSTVLRAWLDQMLPFTLAVANPEGTVPDEFNPAMQAVGLENLLATGRAQGVDDELAGHLRASLALMRRAAAA